MSADIAVPEHDRETRFYQRILGTGENPLWQEDLLNSRGIPIIGLGERTDAYADLPLCWMPHIMVADVASSASRALELGGDELLHGRDANGVSQWAALSDPSGAAFGIIPVVPSESLPPFDEEAPPTGVIAWLDLTIPDAPAVRDFYREVVGWQVEDVAMKDGDEAYADFNMLGGDGKPAAGVCHARGVNAGLRPTWMLYLPVGDLEESLRRVRQEGGAVLKEVRGSSGECTCAFIEDPLGIAIGLVPG
ncbi:MAG: VOC family protein [Acidobacteriota bacterium]